MKKLPSDQSCYSGSSSYFSLSEDDQQKSKSKSGSRERNAQLSKQRRSSSESTLPYVKDTASQKQRESTSPSSLDFSTDSEPVSKAPPLPEKGQLQPEKANRKQNKSPLTCEEKPRTEGRSDHSKSRQERGENPKEKSPESVRSGRKAKRKTHAGSKWDSESNSERGGNQNDKEDARSSSSKEEGEATSESDTDSSFAKCKVKLDCSSGVLKASKRQSSASETDSSHSNSNVRGKNRKQKRGSKKNPKKAHSKKAKEKVKGKKEKKHKAQKRKEPFHWQPPLEFGEEEEEEEVAVKPTVAKKEKQDVKVKKHERAVESNGAVKDQPKDDEKIQEDSIPSDKAGGDTSSPAVNVRDKSNRGEPSAAQTTNPNENEDVSEGSDAAKANNESEGDVTQMDDMELCTPDRTSPTKADVGLPPVRLKVDLQGGQVSNEPSESNNLEADRLTGGGDAKGPGGVKESSREKEKQSPRPSMAVESVLKTETDENAQRNLVDNKWKPLKGVGNLQVAVATGSGNAVEAKTVVSLSESKPQGLRIEIKSKTKIRPGSLFDEVRKTARLNRRPRNRESSSEEDSLARENRQSSRSCSRSKSDPKSRHRTRSVSYSRSRSRTRSSTYSYRYV